MFKLYFEIVSRIKLYHANEVVKCFNCFVVVARLVVLVVLVVLEAATAFGEISTAHLLLMRQWKPLTPYSRLAREWTTRTHRSRWLTRRSPRN